MYYAEQVIDQLDRRFNLVLNSPKENLVFEIFDFYNWAWNEPVIHPYMVMFVKDYEAVTLSLGLVVIPEDLQIEIRQIMNALIEYDSELDDRDMDFDSIPVGLDEAAKNIFKYNFSFKRLETLLAGQENRHRTLFETGEKEETNLAQCLSILSAKLTQAFPDNSSHEGRTRLIHLFQELMEELRHRFHAYTQYVRTSAGAALLFNYQTVQEINPAPVKGSDFHDFVTNVSASPHATFVSRAMAAYYFDGGGEEPFDAHKLLHQARRVYEELRVSLGSRLSHQLLLAKYRARVSWYDKERSRELALINKQRAENTLMLELAKWLFDQGVPVLVRPKFGNHEPDLLSFGNRRIVLEGKVSSKRGTKILDNLSQLHFYLTSLEGTPLSATEGYYVIFRLDGPVYEFPDVIHTERYTIYPFLIDLGDKPSNRKQKPPKLVSVEQVLQAFKKPYKYRDMEEQA